MDFLASFLSLPAIFQIQDYQKHIDFNIIWMISNMINNSKIGHELSKLKYDTFIRIENKNRLLNYTCM